MILNLSRQRDRMVKAHDGPVGKNLVHSQIGRARLLRTEPDNFEFRRNRRRMKYVAQPSPSLFVAGSPVRRLAIRQDHDPTTHRSRNQFGLDGIEQRGLQIASSLSRLLTPDLFTNHRLRITANSHRCRCHPDRIRRRQQHANRVTRGDAVQFLNGRAKRRVEQRPAVGGPQHRQRIVDDQDRVAAIGCSDPVRVEQRTGQRHHQTENGERSQ